MIFVWLLVGLWALLMASPIIAGIMMAAGRVPKKGRGDII